MNAQRLLERFIRYAEVETTACEGSGTYPSSPGQLDLGRLVAAELTEIGLSDVQHTEHGLVLATLPANVTDAPTIAFCSHFDTSPESSGKNVKPQVIRDYAGGDITLPTDTSRVIRVAENPELKDLHARTLITTDGTTLLGADDKAGLAVIVEMAQHLLEHPDIPHGDVKLCFTCDEEIGHGVDYVPLEELAATACYTLDGPGQNTIDVETFSADLATVTVRGINIHPSIAKGRMINAIRVAASFVDKLPRDHRAPEVTSDREGFLHPYHIEGGVAETKMRILLRDFDTPELAAHAEVLKQAAAATEQEFPGSQIKIDIIAQYRNMADGLATEPRAVEYAKLAHQRLGRTAELTIIRGGTDGSRLTELGLPTPNLSTGQHNPHSPLEWCCLEEMTAATEVLIELCRLWGTGGK